jgi:hypothetical protein
MNNCIISERVHVFILLDLFLKTFSYRILHMHSFLELKQKHCEWETVKKDSVLCIHASHITLKKPFCFPNNDIFICELQSNINIKIQIAIQFYLVFSGVRVARSLVLCVCFVDRFCSFSFRHCVVCPLIYYGFWLSLWYLKIPSYMNKRRLF